MSFDSAHPKDASGHLSTWKFLKFWKSEAWDKISEKIYNSENHLPRTVDIFNALHMTPFDKVKVVILGQDPYPTRGHAHGLAFSVQPHVTPLPRSLRNILQEYKDDLGYPEPRNGDLRVWAERGVLLWNTVLTVEEGKAGSHRGIGWEKLTYEIIRALAERGSVVFVLWGKQAQEYSSACSPCPVVSSPHPSPLAKGYLGSRPFSRANAELVKLGVTPVDWKLT